MVQMHLVAPMGSLNFRVTLRKLPPIHSITLTPNPDQPTQKLQQILQGAKAASQKGVDTAIAMVEAHNKLQTALRAHGHQHVNIAFHGLDTGKIEADVTDVKSAQEASITGLEASARLGKGYAIQPFQQRMRQVPSSFENDGTQSSTGTYLIPDNEYFTAVHE